MRVVRRVNSSAVGECANLYEIVQKVYSQEVDSVQLQNCQKSSMPSIVMSIKDYPHRVNPVQNVGPDKPQHVLN